MAAPLIAAAAAGKLAENKWTPVIIGGVVVGVVALAYFGVYKPILCKFGVVECKSSKQNDKIEGELLSHKALNPNFYQARYITISHEFAKSLADDIEDALSGIGDDEDAVYSVIKSSGSEHNMSLISHYYKIRHQEDLSARIIRDFNSDERKTVLELLKNL